MLKNRQEELKVAKELNYCFSNKIIPLFEILKDIYKVQYKKDPITGDYIYIQKGKKKQKVKEESTDSDIITLEHINDLINGKVAFIDFFRFSKDKYGNNIDLSSVDLSVRISFNINLYKKRVLEVTKYKNLIPVISIKPSFKFKKNDLRDFLIELQTKSKSIGLRITDHFIQDYKDLIESLLRDSDFLLFDIEEQNPKSKVMELEEIMELKTLSKKILLNSPRKASIFNREFEESGITKLIDNSARDIFSEYVFHGFGDYCGYKDALPEKRNNYGVGAALALIYQYEDNGFYSFCNHKIKGFSGYRDIIESILKMKHYFEKINKCPGLEKIKNLQIKRKTGNWATWNNIIITRYIHQMYLNI